MNLADRALSDKCRGASRTTETVLEGQLNVAVNTPSLYRCCYDNLVQGQGLLKTNNFKGFSVLSAFSAPICNLTLCQHAYWRQIVSATLGWKYSKSGEFYSNGVTIATCHNTLQDPISTAH